MKNREVIDKILAYHPTLENYHGCDEYKAGNPEDTCTGIVSALVPTVEVIRKTAELGCNLLVTHEPISYQTPDFPTWRGSYPNHVYEEKEKLLRETGITVWRDHDHMHAHRPDSIFTGVIHYLGWDAYYKPVDRVGLFPIDLPETTVGELGEYLKEKLSLNGLRYMGNPTDKISRVAIVGHLFPNCFMPEGVGEDGFYHDYAMEVIRIMEEEGVQAILPGEIIEWTVLSYIRDGIAQGKPLACYNIGHFNWEELGMKYAADWIGDLVDHQLPVHYVPTGDAFSYL